MRISVYGGGYVGLVSAVCLAKLGHQVICTDINYARINALASGECPIYEEDLPQFLNDELGSGRLRFTAEVALAIQHGSVHFIATGTPSLDDGSADLSQVFSVARYVAERVETDCVLVTKSTVPVGTGDAIEAVIREVSLAAQKKLRIDVVSNPEFLREGCAVHDFLKADRIVIGGNEQGLEVMKMVYQPMVEQGVPLVCMTRQSAELTKYAANAMLACKISFINQISRIAEKVGANIDEVKEGIAYDHRIGPHFLNAGIGYGGSCFPKDSRALIHTAKGLGENTYLLEAVEKINQLQKEWVIEQLQHHFKNKLQNLTIAIWGLAFKPGTNDMREASSLIIIKRLLEVGAKVRVYDPAAAQTAKALLPQTSAIYWSESAEDAIQNSVDALVIATEWPQFQNYSLTALKHGLDGAPVIDGRNCYELAKVEKAGISYYYSVGRPLIRRPS